jgi:hypothetical protein
MQGNEINIGGLRWFSPLSLVIKGAVYLQEMPKLSK